MSTEDDEALAWAGDNDERLTTGSTSKSPVRKRRASPSSSPEGEVAAAADSAAAGSQRVVGEAWTPSAVLPSTDGSTDSDSDADEEDAPKGLSSSEGVFIGILGGIYLLFSAAWIVTALGDPVQIEDPLGSFMFILGLWLAAAAPAAWFAAMLVFGRRRSFLWRFAMLALGAVLVIPWPYFFRGA
jgi:hypothetical protein